MSLHHHAFHILIYLSLFLSIFTHPTTSTQQHNHHEKQIFIVAVDNNLKPSELLNDVEAWYNSILDNVITTRNGDSYGNTNYPLIHVYKTVFVGFSAHLTPAQAEALKAHPSVLDVFPDEIYQLHTTRTPQFLGLGSYQKPTGLLKDSDFGSNTVIGILDTGIWPESPSFKDDGLGPVPAHFKGACEGGEHFPRSLCNKKLVGVRDMLPIILPYTAKSARDDVGHGTHTASTAAGRTLAGNTSFFGYAAGEATGIAAKARVAAYKVCQPKGCMSSSIMDAIDKAVEDGVDVISLSLGPRPTTSHNDPLAIAAYTAVLKGVFVSASAGNSGPTPQTVSNGAPWITTIGASTIDRTFPADLILGNGDVFTGSSLYTDKPPSPSKYFPLVHFNSTLEQQQCTEELPAEAKGKIVIRLQGSESPAEKGVTVKNAGGVGVIVPNDPNYGELLLGNPFYGIPGLSITNSAREKLLNYTASTSGPKARIVFHGTRIPSGPAPSVASFSSRGPNLQSGYVLKPDVIAPGVDILASWADNIPPSGLDDDPRKSGFNIISGTSMSCPHVSGIAALLKGAHPDWTPAMIRSALMTTAYNTYKDGKPILAQENNLPAPVWARGAGHVDPEKANDPGLVLDLTGDDYIDFMCAANYSKLEIRMILKKEIDCEKRTKKAVWDLNYPAVVVKTTTSTTHTQQAGKPPSDVVSFTVTRTVTNVGSGSSSYKAEIVSPKGVKVSVKPTELSFKEKGEKKSFQVEISSEKKKDGDETAEGSLTWTDGKHRVSLPLVVVA